MGRLLHPSHVALLGPLYAYSLFSFIRHRVLTPIQDWPNPHVADKTWSTDKFFIIFWWLHTLGCCVHTYGIAPYFLHKMHQYRANARSSASPFQWFVFSVWFSLAFTPLPLISAGKGRSVAYSRVTYYDNSLHAFVIVALCLYLAKRLMSATHEFASKRTDRIAVRECWTRLIGLSTFTWILGGRALPIMAVGEHFLFNHQIVNAVFAICLTSSEPLFAYYYIRVRVQRELDLVRRGRPC